MCGNSATFLGLCDNYATLGRAGALDQKDLIRLNPAQILAFSRFIEKNLRWGLDKSPLGFYIWSTRKKSLSV
jgi:hypothetical protein